MVYGFITVTACCVVFFVRVLLKYKISSLVIVLIRISAVLLVKARHHHLPPSCPSLIHD